MSGNNSVETKPTAAALAEPTTPSAAKAKPGLIGFKQRYWLVAGVGCGLALAAGVYGYKYFSAIPGRVVAQTEPPPTTPITTVEQPAKLPTIPDNPRLDLNPPEMPLPPVLPVKNETEIPAEPIAGIQVPGYGGRVKSAPTRG